MKKTLYIAAAVIAVMFAASCQKDDVQAVKKGMTLSANVEETKATIDRDDKGEKVVWHFSWQTRDVVSVTSPSPELYSFVYDGTSFKCETAVPEAGKWEAVYPMSYTTDGISFLNQDGTLESAMKKYFLKGSCESDGSATLKMEMTPKFAILKIRNTKAEDLWFSLGDKQKKNHPSIYKEETLTNVTSTYPDVQGNCKIGTVEAGQESYYIVPAGSYYLIHAKGSINNITMGTSYKNEPKTFVAGKIYNVTF